MRKNAYHRSRIDILYAILKFISDEGYAKKTHILYATNLNTRSLEKFLNFLKEINAIDVIENDGVKYILTFHGRQLLKLILRLQNILSGKDRLSRMTTQEYIDKLNNVLKRSIDDYFHTLQVEKIKGFSGLSYNVNMVIGGKDKYIIIPINKIHNDNCYEIEETACKAILYLMDTQYKCIIVFNGENNNCSYIQNSFKNFLSRLSISEERYFFAKI